MSASNSFGQIFRFTTFGESHGPAMGVIIDGCPAGLFIDQKFIQQELDRRRPGQSATVTSRNEQDQLQLLSGVFEGKTLGTPIMMMVQNQNHKSEDYKQIDPQTNPRQGHADDLWFSKYGHSDFRGGGRSSGRETVARVMAGAIAKLYLNQKAPDLVIKCYIQQVHKFKLTSEEESRFLNGQQSVDQFENRFPSIDKSKLLTDHLLQAKAQGESYGGWISVVAQNVPRNLGQPVFHKLKADLAFAMLSIGSTVGFEMAYGFEDVLKPGTEFHQMGKQSQYAGIRGGISTGEDIQFRIALKPTSSILDVAKKGRHDPCILIRAVPVVEAMVACVLTDHLLMQRSDRI